MNKYVQYLRDDEMQAKLGESYKNLSGLEKLQAREKEYLNRTSKVDDLFQPNENYYALVIGENVIKVILSKTVIVNTVTWNLESIGISNDCDLTRDEVLKELRSALKEYGLFGYEILGKTEVETIVTF